MASPPGMTSVAFAMTSTFPSDTTLFREARSYGTFLIVAGVIGAIAGILALVYPDITLLALALIAGINLMLLGVLALIEAFGGDRDAGARVLAAILGILGIIAGLVVIRRPGESLLAIVVILGIWFVVSGIVDFIRAFATLEGRAFRLMMALADIILGALILALPKLSLATLAILVGIAFVIRGVVSIVRGFALRRAAKEASHEDSPSPAVAT
jgi:uncharacterized membrane protein HdeD (DUF308 family)